MKKFLYTLLFAAVLIACEDNFEQFYKGGIPSLSEFRVRIGDFNWDSSGSDGKYNYGIHGDNYGYSVPQSIRINMPYTGSTFTGGIQSSVDWEFTNVPEWLTISPSSGTGVIETSNYQEPVPVTFTLSENSYITPRFATVYLEGTKDGWKMVDTLRFTQYGITPEFIGGEQQIIMKAKADTSYTYFSSNCEFGVECSNNYWEEESSVPDWFKAEVVKSDSVGFTHKIIVTSVDYTKKSSSSYYDSYSGYLKFYTTNLETGKKEYLDYKIEVIKQSPNIDLTPDNTEDNDWWENNITRELSPEGQKFSMLVNANYDFSIESDKEWLSFTTTPINEEGYSHRIDIEVTDFSSEDIDSHTSYRSGFIRFYDPKDINTENRAVFGSIEIRQMEPSIKQYREDYYYNINGMSVSFEPQSSTQTIYVTANYNFGVKHSDWFSVSVEPVSHEFHTHKIEISVPDYPTSNGVWSTREGNIQFIYNGSFNTQYLRIYQNAPSASFNEYSLNFKGFASKDTVNVTANCKFTTSCSAEWFHVDKIITNDSSYNAQIVIAVQEFPTATTAGSSRSGEITLYYDADGSNIIKELDYMYINQESHKITTPQTSYYTVKSNAQTLSFDIEADAAWTASTDASWITLNSSSGAMGKHTITLNIDELPAGTYSRYGYINFMLYGKEKLSIEIYQVQTD